MKKLTYIIFSVLVFALSIAYTIGSIPVIRHSFPQA